MNWNSKLWGVTLRNAKGKHVLISTIFDTSCAYRDYYDGEPTRALLFTTRKAARKWCAEKSDPDSAWFYSPVRVVETVREVK